MPGLIYRTQTPRFTHPSRRPYTTRVRARKKKRHKNSRDFILTSSFHLLFVYYMNYLYIISTRQMGRWSIVFFWSTGARLFLDYSKRETMEWQKNLAKVAETWLLPTRANCFRIGFCFFFGGILIKILHYFFFRL